MVSPFSTVTRGHDEALLALRFLVYGTTGTFAFLGGYFAAWLGLKRALPWLIIAMNAPNLVFYFLGAQHPENLSVIATALALEMFGYGFGFVGLISFMMQVVAVGKFQTAHYALATGVMQLGLVISKIFSGAAQKKLGYNHFFIWVLISAIPVLVLCFFMKIKGKDESGTSVPNGAVEA
jgi:PAT family beta-lactamase induction signal transducer AmpG